MRIALHHEQFVVSPQDVRVPVEVRWRAFRGRSHPAARAEEEAAASSRHAETDTISDPDTSRRRSGATAVSLTSEPLRFGDAALLSTPWDMVKLGTALVVLLIVGSNALGLWETDAQEERRLERQAQAEEARKEREEEARRKKKWDDMWKDFDRSFKRM
jgi:hypothetical protein